MASELTLITPSRIRSNSPCWIAQNTKGGGDCALHAVFGEPNSKGEYECIDTSAHRKVLHEKVADSKPGSPLYRLAQESIQELIISGRTIGAESRKLFESHQQFLHKQNTSSPKLWEQFETTLWQYPGITDYIAKHHQHPHGTSASLREQFYDALTRKEGTLYGLIYSLLTLDKAFKLYNTEVNKPYNWHVSSAMLQEYATFIGKPGQWLLPSEVALIAEAFKITVEYYLHPEAPTLEIFNPNQSKTVTIRFNGRDHFERLTRTIPVEQKLSRSISSQPDSAFSSPSSDSSITTSSSNSTDPISTTVPIISTPRTISNSHDTTPQYPDLRTELQAAYSEESKCHLPMSLSETDRLCPIQTISLTINTKKLQTIKDDEFIVSTGHHQEGKTVEQKEKKSKQRKAWEFGRERLAREEAWHRIEKPILIEDIFKQSSAGFADKPVKRLLIEGRAGVGKTTLVQFIAYQWATKELFNRDYDYLLWVPLREWLVDQNCAPKDLATFLCERYFKKKTTSAPLIEQLAAILNEDSKGSDRTLLMLDGYDEVAHYLKKQPKSVYAELLLQALQFKQVIVTTRDYQLPSMTFDNALVNIGFTDAQIEHYIAHYPSWLGTSLTLDSKETSSPTKLKSDSAAHTLIKTLRSNPRLWAMAHIPLNLALICELQWSYILTKQSDTALTNLTLSALYQKIIKNFLLQQLEKDQKTKSLNMKTLRKYFVVELDALCTLAWEGFKQGKVILSSKTQNEMFGELSIRFSKQENQLEPYYLRRAFGLGLLRDVGRKNSCLLEQRRYFIHLTFHEYLAAQYVVDTLQGYRGKKHYQKILTWIKQDKYEPHVAVVMGFIAGISAESEYEHARKAFWYALLSSPHDIIGLSHLRLMLRCLEEADYNENIPHRAQLLEEIERWANLLLSPELCHTGAAKGFWKLMHQYPEVWKQTPHLMNSLLKAMGNQHSLEVRMPAIEALATSMGGELANQPEALAAVLEAAGDRDAGIRQIAKDVLSKIGDKLEHQPKALVSVLNTARNPNIYVQQEARKLLEKIGRILVTNPKVFAFVLKKANDPNDNVRLVAVSALGTMGGELARQPEALEVVFKAVSDQNDHIQQEAKNIIKKTELVLITESKAFTSILKAADDQNDSIRLVGINALGTIGEGLVHQHEAFAIVLKATEDRNDQVRLAAVKSLINTKVELANQPKALAVILKALNDKQKDVRCKVVKALGEIINILLVCQPSILVTVLKIAGNQDRDIQQAARESLGSMSIEVMRQPEILAPLLQAANHKYWAIRLAVIEMFRKLGPKLICESQILEVVLNATNDPISDVRRAAVSALANMEVELVRQPKALAIILVKVTEDQNLYVRQEALVALTKIGAELIHLPEALEVVLRATSYGTSDVRRMAIETLGKINEGLRRQPNILSAIIKSTEDPANEVRQVAVEILGKMEIELTHLDVLAAVLKSAEDKDDPVRAAAVKILGAMGKKLAHLPLALKVIFKAISDQNDDLNQIGVKALRSIGKQLEMVLISNPQVIGIVLKVASRYDEFVYEMAVKAFSAMSKDLEELDSQVLSGVLQASCMKNLDSVRFKFYNTFRKITEKTVDKLIVSPQIREGAIKATHFYAPWAVYTDVHWAGLRAHSALYMQTHWSKYVKSALEYFLSKENSSTLQSGIVAITSLKFIPSTASLILDKQTIQIHFGNEIEILEFSSLDRIKLKPLIESITQEYARYGLMLPGYADCVEEKLFWGEKKQFYPETKQPSFNNEATWPEPPELSSIGSSVRIRRELIEEIKYNFDNENRSQQLKERFKPPSSPKGATTEITISMSTAAADDNKLSSQKLNEESESLPSIITQGDRPVSLGSDVVPDKLEPSSDFKDSKTATPEPDCSDDHSSTTIHDSTLAEHSFTSASTTLQVNRSQLTDEGLAALAKMLSKNTSITKLTLPEDRKRSQASAQSHARIHAYLYRNRLLTAQKVTAQELHDVDFSVLTGEDLRSLLLRHKALDTWDFSDKQLDAKAVILQPAYLPRYSSLRTLNLDNNRLGDAGAEQIGRLLKLNPSLLPNLVVLTLANNRIRDMGFHYLALAMADVRLEVLDLSGNTILLSGATLQTRAEEFAKNSHLQRITLSGNALLPSADTLLVNDKDVKKSKNPLSLKHSDISSLGSPIAFFHSQPLRMRSIIDPSKEIDRGQWVVALGCKKDDQHAMLYLEGMRESGQRFITRYHIIAPAVLSDEAQVKIKTLDIGRLVNSHHRHYFRSFTIDRVKGESLQGHVESQQASNEEIPFSTFYNSSTGRVNCTGWCRTELIRIGLEVPTTDIPSVAAGGPPPGSSCLVM